jgi:hypothetical protein
MPEDIPRSPTEPSADIRQAASTMWQIFVALTSEGFSEEQSLTIISNMLLGNQGRP